MTNISRPIRQQKFNVSILYTLNTIAFLAVHLESIDRGSTGSGGQLTPYFFKWGSKNTV